MTNEDFQSYLLDELKDPHLALEFIRDAIESPSDDNDEIGYLMHAISQVAKAHGITDLASQTGLGRSTIYKILNEDSNPSFKNVVKILNAIGLKFSVTLLDETKKSASALDVAEYILNHLSNAFRETTFWLQKLVYYSQVMHLINYKCPLFYESIEAWKNGPVIRELYNKHKGIRYLTRNLNFGDEKNLSQRQKQCIDLAIEKYGTSTGEVLSELTHSEDPWKKAIKNPTCNQITHDMILEYYLNRPNYDDDKDLYTLT